MIGGAELTQSLRCLLWTVGELDNHMQGVVSVARETTERLYRVTAATAKAIPMAAANRNDHLSWLHHQAANFASQALDQAGKQVWRAYYRTLLGIVFEYYP
ncbi:hypothetical protein cyc_02579 [Cyclospora cayetanensis]|uniref:Uncharacterized protein n=1 Tax=Cyclospora cayetanensis TaxID=88456 RepID=A0A1D3CYV4_9EIME|nr:hypothetical protein cyc_02579 [Cyclospora cayetanensis]